MVHIFDGTKWNRMAYSENNLYSRLIKDKLGVGAVTFSNINTTNSYAGFTSLFDGVDNLHAATFHVRKSGSPVGDWGFGIVLPNKYTIQEIIFDGRNDCCTNRINNVLVRLYRCGVLIYSSSPISSATTGDNKLIIPNIYADEIRIVVPNGGTAGTGTVINFSELKIIAKD